MYSNVHVYHEDSLKLKRKRQKERKSTIAEEKKTTIYFMHGL